jgi:hypothetical protein
MLTFGGQDFQYFRADRFDFHRVRAPDDYWILEAQAPIAWLFGCAVSLISAWPQGSCLRSQRRDLRLSNPDWNEYELPGGIRWLRAMLAASF